MAQNKLNKELKNLKTDPMPQVLIDSGLSLFFFPALITE